MNTQDAEDLAEDLAARGLCGVMATALTGAGVPPPVAAVLAERACVPAVQAGQREVEKQKQKGKRKVTAYAREFGRQYRLMRSKHPRMTHRQITKKAHVEARKKFKATK